MNINDKEFKNIMDTLQETIVGWDYYVNWAKVLGNYEKIKVPLNILNSLIGSQKIEQDAKDIFIKYPEVIEVLPVLIAVRDTKLKTCISIETMKVDTLTFDSKTFDLKQVDKYVNFLQISGLANLFRDRKIKSIPDYIIGVEIGLDSNGRKNRGGQKMEHIISDFLQSKQHQFNFEYIEQATQKSIKEEWGIDIQMDKSNRRIDFAIFKDGIVYLLEANFYGGGGSKLKSTATEYIEISNRFSKDPNVKYGWVTDGYGWYTAEKPLREFFDTNNNLMNLHILKNGGLEKFLNS